LFSSESEKLWFDPFRISQFKSDPIYGTIGIIAGCS
jgi:hypothetical protein